MATSDLMVVIEADTEHAQRALSYAATRVAELVELVNRMTESMGVSVAEFGRLLVQATAMSPPSRCEMAARRRVEQAMRLRARRAARRARRAASRASRAAA